MMGRLWQGTSAMHKVHGFKLSFNRELRMTRHPLQESSKTLGKPGLHLALWWVVRVRLQLKFIFSPEGDCSLHPYWGLDDERDPINEDHPWCSFSDLDFHHNRCNRWK